MVNWLVGSSFCLLSRSALTTTDGTALGLQRGWGVQDRQTAQSPPTGARLPAPSQGALSWPPKLQYTGPQEAGSSH